MGVLQLRFFAYLLLTYFREHHPLQQGLRHRTGSYFLILMLIVKNIVEQAVTYSLKLTQEWHLSPVRIKENLQKLIFPEGVRYDVKKEAFRTERVNLVFAVNASGNSLSEEEINKQGGLKATLFCFVGWTGFEPATPCTPYKCATGLRHHPKYQYYLPNTF